LAPTPFDRRQFHEGPLPLTKRHVIELAFSQLHAPYGWGGYLGNRDCSRFLHDILASFDILMARNSAAQSTMGAHNIGLEGMSDAEKLSTIEELNTDNLVLLYMPGHIMLYLGNDGADHFALSSLSEYLRPCDDGGAQTVRLDRVEVTPLELGRGTSRTSFVERMTTAVVFGPG
ncbi:MAG: NlpC/P60 family protein, partial [Nannocystaceae bacterium]